MFVGLCIYDAYVYIKEGNPATITFVIKDFLHSWPIAGIVLGIVLGILIGHIAWQVGGGKDPVVTIVRKVGISR